MMENVFGNNRSKIVTSFT